MKVEIIKIPGTKVPARYNISIRVPHDSVLTGRLCTPVVLQTTLADAEEDVTLISSFTEEELKNLYLALVDAF